MRGYRLATEVPNDKKARLERERAARRGRTNQAYRRGLKNAVQMARMSQTWPSGPRNAV